MADFEKAPEVRMIAEKLIDQHHPHLQDSKDLIGYYFRIGGGVNWSGKAKKCTTFERHITKKMLFIHIIKSDFNLMDDHQKEALVDHELCHFKREYDMIITDIEQEPEKRWCNRDDPDSWSIREHDVEEFKDVITRHGLWEKGIEQFAEALRETEYQLTFADVKREAS